MQCDDARQYMAEMVYGEDSCSLPGEFKVHFAQCRECVAEYLTLLETKQSLSVWKDEEPPSRWVFVADPERKRIPDWLGWLGMWRRPAFAYAFGFFLLIVGMSLLRLQLSWGDGRISLQSAWFGPKTDALSENSFSQEESARPQELTAALEKGMAGSEMRQNQQTVALLQKAMEAMDYQRQMDLLRLRGEIETLQQAYYQSIERNNTLLEQNVKYMNQTRY